MAVVIHLAYFEPTDTSGSSIGIILLCALLIAGPAILALLLIGFSRNRRNRHADVVAAAAVVWALIAGGMMIYVTLTQIRWSKEKVTRLQSGYLDPTDNTGAPHQPWIVWGILIVAYVALLAWSLSRRDLPVASIRNDEC